MAESEKEDIEPPHFVYIWTIENMCETCSVVSPTFTVKEMQMTKWGIWINSYDTNFVGLCFTRAQQDNGPESIEIKVEFSVLKIDGLPLIEKKGVKEFKKDSGLCFEEFCLKNEVFFQRREEFLPKEAITIRCRMWRIGTKITKIDSCFARTMLRSGRSCFVWAIRDFSTLQKAQARKVIFKSTKEDQWNFDLFLTEKDGEEYINIHANYIGDLYVHGVKISLLDFEGKVVHSEEKSEYGNDDFHFKEYLTKSRLMNKIESLLHNDVLTLTCEFELEVEPVWSVIENYRYPSCRMSEATGTDAEEIVCIEYDKTSNAFSSFTMAMKNLMEEGTLSDVNLRTNSKLFHAHKCILSARSSVFNAMFTGDTKEKTNKCVDIPNLDEETLRELLSYIYTDKVNELDWECAIKLYKAADKYELLQLKKRCIIILKSELSADSVFSVLNVADLHNDKELREAAEEYVMCQGKEFFTSDLWQSFREENSKFACEIMERIVCRMKR